MFEKGDIVRLKSGGPRMTIEEIRPEDELILCVWFTKQNVCDRLFHKEALMKNEKSSEYVEPHYK